MPPRQKIKTLPKKPSGQRLSAVIRHQAIEYTFNEWLEQAIEDRDWDAAQDVMNWYGFYMERKGVS